MAKICHFNDAWLRNTDYGDWLDRAGTHKARCRVCQKTFDIRNMGESALRSHSKGRKHKKLMESLRVNAGCRITDFIRTTPATSATRPETSTVQAETHGATATTEPDSLTENVGGQVPRKSSVDLVTKDEVLKAELLWALHVIEKHQSYRSCEGIGSLFQTMFSDSDIAGQFKCSEKKTAYLNVFGLAPHFRKILRQKLDSKYVLLFDESLNKKNQRKQMDFYVRFWNNGEVMSRYYDSKFVGHCTAADMQIEFNSIMESLNPRNLVQLSMDGPSVNWKFHNNIQTDLETNYGKSLLNVGSCGLHIVHGAFQTGVEKSDLGTAQFLTSFYNLFRDSPARREDYTNVTNGANLPLKFCKTRWVDNIPCASRALEVWEDIGKYVAEVNKKSVPNPDNNSYSSLKKFINMPLSLARLNFFIAIAREITPFLTNYQTDKPMLPYIAMDLHKLILGLLERFVKTSVTESLTMAKLACFDVRKASNYVDIANIDLGMVHM